MQTINTLSTYYNIEFLHLETAITDFIHAVQVWCTLRFHFLNHI